MALSALLQGPYEVGSMVLSREGVLEMMLAMADSGDAIHAVSHSLCLVYFIHVLKAPFKQGCHSQGKGQGKKVFRGHGKVREFC